MTTEYKIYVVNDSLRTHKFWAFLERPEELAADQEVFANSAAYVEIESRYQGLTSFTIPVQYTVGAGASNNAVALDTKVDTLITKATEIGQGWKATYNEPRKGPDLTTGPGSVDPEMISITANNFDQEVNEGMGWYANMSFGIETQMGFMGMTWSPSPGVTRTLKPKQNFYITTGDFDSNKLAKWTDVNRKGQLVTEDDFHNVTKDATVVLHTNGKFSVYEGKPRETFDERLLAGLAASHRSLCSAHAKLVDLAGQPMRSGGAETAAIQDTVESVTWHAGADKKSEVRFLSGTITVGTAVAAAASVFVLSNIRFQITKVTAGGTSIDFTYSGQESVAVIKKLLTAGKEITVK